MCIFFDPILLLMGDAGNTLYKIPIEKLRPSFKNINSMNPDELIPGKIYFISFGASTNLVGRFKDMDTCNLIFFDLIHYWNSFETFHKDKSNAWCVKSGAEIREASLPEKHALIKFELENNCI